MKKIYILLSLVISMVSHASVHVQLFEDGVMTDQLSLPDNSRLSDLLHDEHVPSEIYWRSAQLTNTSRMEASNSEKTSLMGELDALRDYWRGARKNDLAMSVQKLIDDISTISVSGHFSLGIDPDLSRVDTAYNPPLKGNYVFFVAARKPWLNLIGLTTSDSRQGLYPGVGVSEYWQGYHLLPGADPAVVYLIQPTAEIELVPVAIWNRLHREPMAGATIFIGFDPDILPHEYKNINERIAKLITNRIPQ